MPVNSLAKVYAYHLILFTLYTRLRGRAIMLKLQKACFYGKGKYTNYKIVNLSRMSHSFAVIKNLQ